ncbi:MAG: lipid-A-disaccharide synthase N-terminal domain-containing protein [Chryseolinea sp.]
MELLELHWIYAIGFAGQSLFGARMIVQWLSSEKEGKVVSPTLYWQISLIASSIILSYGILRADGIIILGQFLSYYIYIRNLQLKNSWLNINVLARAGLLMLPIIILTVFITSSPKVLESISAQTDFQQPIVVFGAIGQLILNFRFIYQWYYSEKKKLSILPLGFWVISLMASILILIYGFVRKDPVLLVSQSLGCVAYVRNIILYTRKSSVPKMHDA